MAETFHKTEQCKQHTYFEIIAALWLIFVHSISKNITICIDSDIQTGCQLPAHTRTEKWVKCSQWKSVARVCKHNIYNYVKISQIQTNGTSWLQFGWTRLHIVLLQILHHTVNTTITWRHHNHRTWQIMTTICADKTKHPFVQHILHHITTHTNNSTSNQNHTSFTLYLSPAYNNRIPLRFHPITMENEWCYSIQVHCQASSETTTPKLLQ